MASLQPLHTQVLDVMRAELGESMAAIPADVHGARKRCKKLRATLRLLRGPLGERYSPLNRSIRDVARALSGQRDDDVVAALCTQLDKEAPELAWGNLPDALPAARPGSAGFEEAHALLQAVDDQLAAEGLPPITPEDLASGLRNGYRRARKRWRRALPDPKDATPLHEWRKEVKYHMHHCQLLTPLWPALKSRRKALDRLADGLGDHHDRYMLEQRIKDLSTQAPEAHAHRLDQLEREQEWLAKRALRQAETLFALSPGAWWHRQTQQA